MIDLSFRALFAMQSGRPYAITGTFDGVDLVNGGKHNAVDVGNFGMDDPILAPITGRARGLFHFDSAIGIAYELSAEWRLELWHLNATLSDGLALVPGRSDVGDWVDVDRGQICGRTGNSGALVGGRPMPAHTHIALFRNGIPLDAAPYLLGAALQIGGAPDVNYPRPMKPLALVTIAAGNNLRRTPSLTAEARLLAAPAQVGVCAVVTGQAWGDKGSDWLWVGFEKEMWCIHSALAPGVSATDLGKALLSPPATAGIDPAVHAAAVTERDRLAGRVQAKDAAIAAYPKG